MKELFNNKKLGITTLVVLFYFGIFFFMNYTEEAYLLFAGGWEQVSSYMKVGSVLPGAFFAILKFIRIPSYGIYLLSYGMAIVLTVLTILECTKWLEKYTNQENMALLLSMGIVLNPWMIGGYLTLEKGFILLSIYACIKAVQLLDQKIEEKDKSRKKLIKPFLWLLLVAFTTPKMMSLFVVLTILPILKYSKSLKQWLRNEGNVILFYTIPSALSYVWCKLLQDEGLEGPIQMIENGKTFFVKFYEGIKNGFGIYPAFFLPLIGILLLALSIFFIQNKKKKKLNSYGSIIYMAIITLVFTMIPFLFRNEESIVIDEISLYAMGSMIGIFMVVFQKTIKKEFLLIILILMLGGEYFAFTNSAINRFVGNYAEKQMMETINKKVSAYESTTGQAVDKIAIYRDDLNRNKDTAIGMLKYYTKRDLTITEQNDYISDRYFKSKDWKEFTEDQVVIVNETLHWYLY